LNEQSFECGLNNSNTVTKMYMGRFTLKSKMLASTSGGSVKSAACDSSCSSLMVYRNTSQRGLRVGRVPRLEGPPELQKQGPLASCTLIINHKLQSANHTSMQPYVAHYVGISIASATTVTYE